MERFVIKVNDDTSFDYGNVEEMKKGEKRKEMKKE